MKTLSITLIGLLFLGLTAAAKDTPATPPPTAETAPRYEMAPTVFEGVNLASTAKVGTTDLKAVSHGIRRKKVFGIATVDVYVAEFYALTPEKIQKSDDQVLNSLSMAGPVQIKLTLKRELSGSDISKSFKEALKENDVDLSKPVAGLSDLMTEVESIKSFKKGEVFAISGDWSNNQQRIVIQRPDGSTKTITADDASLKKLFSMWLGKPVDDKMNDLKKNLLK